MNEFNSFIEIETNPLTLGSYPSNLDDTDKCVYALKYCGGKGVIFNSHIYNIKKSNDDPYVCYKESSIRFLGESMSRALKVPIIIDQCSIVVIPPSKSKNDPLYDDRLIRILDYAGLSEAVVDMFYLEVSRDPAHIGGLGNSRSVEYHKEIIKYNCELISKLKDTVIIFDDVITSGAQYKAVKNLLLDINPEFKILGLFVARTTCE